MKIKLLCQIHITLFCLTIISIKAAEILPYRDPNGKIVLKLEDNEIALFGYGSLMVLEELHDQDYTGPFIEAELLGFKRTWSARYPNFYQDLELVDLNGNYFFTDSFTYLNIEPCYNCKMNGMLFVITEDELESYNRRESSYNRININDNLLNITILGGNAYAYSAKPNHHFPTNKSTSKYETIIWEHYVDIIEDALNTMGEKFTEDYLDSSQPVPYHLLAE